MRVRVRDRNMVKVRVATTTYVSNEDAFSARSGLPLFLLAAVLHVIFIVRVRIRHRVVVGSYLSFLAALAGLLPCLPSAD